jgi:hypothetical protein
VLHGLKSVEWHIDARPTQRLSLRTRPGDACIDALDDPAALEFRNRAKQVHLQPSCGRRSVDPLRQADECHAERLQLVEQRDQVLETASEAIQPPDHHDIESPPPCIRDQSINRWPTIFGAAHASIHVLLDGPTASLGIPTQLRELVFRLLITGADAGIDGGELGGTIRHRVPVLHT